MQILRNYKRSEFLTLRAISVWWKVNAHIFLTFCIFEREKIRKIQFLHMCKFSSTASVWPCRCVIWVVGLLVDVDDAVIQQERTTDDSKESECLKELLSARTHEYIEEVLQPHFGGMIVFVKDCEVATERGNLEHLKAQESQFVFVFICSRVNVKVVLFAKPHEWTNEWVCVRPLLWRPIAKVKWELRAVPNCFRCQLTVLLCLQLILDLAWLELGSWLFLHCFETRDR